jgi:hypothetical protein
MYIAIHVKCQLDKDTHSLPNCYFYSKRGTIIIRPPKKQQKTKTKKKQQNKTSEHQLTPRPKTTPTHPSPLKKESTINKQT